METKIITITDLQKIKAISSNIEVAKRIDPYIIEAQDIDIRPFLGASLFYDIIKEVKAGVISDKYKNLLNGCEYTDSSSNTLYFDGLKIAIAYFAYSRFLRHQGLNVTSFGVVKKTNDYSESLSKEEIEAEVNNAREVGLAYLDQVKEFLDEKDDIYTLWGDIESHKPSGGIKITAVKNY